MRNTSEGCILSEQQSAVNPTPIAPANATESGMFADAYWTKQDLADKADKVANADEGNIAALDYNGNLADSGMALRDFAVAKSLAPAFVPYNKEGY